MRWAWLGFGAIVWSVACGDTPRDVDDDSDDDSTSSSTNSTQSGAGAAGPTSSNGAGAGTGMEPGALMGITAAHNQWRQSADPSIPDLVWSPTVASVAQAYAEQLVSQGCPLQHSSNEYGENLFWGSGSYSAAEVVDAWGSEIECYSHITFPDACGCTCGHYTQIVWRNTTELGCGIGNCADGSEVWVCNYNPPGNYIGQMAY